ncbi:MAG: hypothetical protein HY903_11520 [Deltaproteobacteria bacterium]|nr:hypothetical protein [Deltaproteobacteria bacterium]
MTMIGSLDSSALNQMDPAFFDPSGMLGPGMTNFFGKMQNDPNLLNRTIERSQNREIKLTTGSFERIKGTNAKGEVAGHVTWASPPSEKYSQAREQAGQFVAMPLEKAGKIHIVEEGGKEGSKAKALALEPKAFTKWVDERMNCGDPKIVGQTKKFLEANGIVKTDSGKYMVHLMPEAGAYNNLFPGMGNNAVGSNVFSTLQNSSWVLPMLGIGAGAAGGYMMGGKGGAAVGALGTLPMMAVAALALKSTAGGGALAPGLVGLGGAGAAGYLGNFGSAAGWGLGATAMGLAGMDGMAYNMKKQMRSYADQSKMDSLIAMCNNPGIPIEDLIAMFMAQMADTYENKLREKLEETARAEKRENEREREKDQGRMVSSSISALGSMAAIIPGVGTGVAMAAQAGGMFYNQYTDAKIAAKDAAGGHTKSSTILMQEVQILMNTWKQVNELLSNLAKTMNDMAMTPIRNLR